MREVLNLARWELFKLAPRWMPWVMLLVLVVFTQMAVWGSYFSYQSQRDGTQISFGTPPTGGSPGRTGTVSCSALLRGEVPPALRDADPMFVESLRQSCLQADWRLEERLAEMRSQFTLPGSIPHALQSTHFLALILLTILSASVVGIDYANGTLRPVLSLGTGRVHYMGAKLVTVAAVVAVGLLVAAVGVALSSVAAASLDEGGGRFAGSWQEALEAPLKVWFSLVPFAALVVAITVIGRSSATGMAVSLGYLIAEQLAAGILLQVFGWFEEVAEFLLVRNILALGSGGAFTSPDFSRPGDLQAVIVLGTYSVAIALMAFSIFERRDVTSSAG
jgi:hypothetical protein